MTWWATKKSIKSINIMKKIITSFWINVYCFFFFSSDDPLFIHFLSWRISFRTMNMWITIVSFFFPFIILEYFFFFFFLYNIFLSFSYLIIIHSSRMMMFFLSLYSLFLYSGIFLDKNHKTGCAYSTPRSSLS